MKIKGRGGGLEPPLIMAMRLARVDQRFAGNPILAVLIASKVFLIKSLRQRLNAAGRQAFEDFQRIADSFSNTRDRLQFLSNNPTSFQELTMLAELPEAIFSHLGINKRQFLAFYGFANLTGLIYFSEKLEQVKMLAKSVGSLPRERGRPIARMASAYRQVARDLEANLAAPKIRLQSEWPVNLGIFRRLLAANTAWPVQLSFDHPKYVWINHHPIPPRFEVNNLAYGKWVVNSLGVSDSVKIVLRLLPFFTTQDLGQAKFDLYPRVPGVTAVIVYSQDRDESVFSILRVAAEKKPFWVPDEFCYEAEALSEVMQNLAVRMVRGGGFNEALLSKLKEPEFCQSRGLSSIQAEIILQLFEPITDHETALAHIIDGYFSDHHAELADLGLGQGGVGDYYRHVLPAVLDDENREYVLQTLTARRVAFERKYSGKRN